MKQKLKNKENKLVLRIAIKAILRWLMFKALAIGVVLFSITAFWNENLTLAQKVVSVIIGIMFAFFPMMVKFDDILDDVITHEKTKREVTVGV